MYIAFLFISLVPYVASSSIGSLGSPNPREIATSACSTILEKVNILKLAEEKQECKSEGQDTLSVKPTLPEDGLCLPRAIKAIQPCLEAAASVKEDCVVEVAKAGSEEMLNSKCYCQAFQELRHKFLYVVDILCPNFGVRNRRQLLTSALAIGGGLAWAGATGATAAAAGVGTRYALKKGYERYKERY